MARESGGAWPRAPAALIEAFGTALEGFPDAQRRQMFGYPAAFANGNMWTGLHSTGWVVRLPDAERAELLALQGARRFEPMPGREMTGFALLPPAVVEDREQLRNWLERAWTAALAMPPKEAGTRRRR